MEARRWMLDRKTISQSPRARLVMVGLCGGLMLCLVPLSTRVSIPAVLESADLARVYPQRPGIVREVRGKVGDAVKAGDVLAILDSPDISHQTTVALRRQALIKLQLARRSADQEDRAKSIVMEKELASVSSELAGLARETENLTIRSPQAGVIAEFNTAVHAGRPIGRAEFVALIRGTQTLVARGYVGEQDVPRLPKGAEGSFVADEPGYPRYPVRLEDIAKAGTANIDIVELASVHGGPVAVRAQAGEVGHRRLTPVEASYLATLSAEPAGANPGFALRGTVQIAGEGRSLAARAWRQVAAVLVRESGF